MKVIQELDLDNNRILNALLQLNPSLVGTGLKGKFGINTQGALVYIANYGGGGDPILNALKELVDDGNGFITIDKTQDNKDIIKLDTTALLNLIIQDDDVSETSTWSSQKISTLLGNVNQLSVIWLTSSDPNPFVLTWDTGEIYDSAGDIITGTTWADVYGQHPTFDCWLEVAPGIYQPSDMTTPTIIMKTTLGDEHQIDTVSFNFSGLGAKIKITI